MLWEARLHRKPYSSLQVLLWPKHQLCRKNKPLDDSRFPPQPPPSKYFLKSSQLLWGRNKPLIILDFQSPGFSENRNYWEVFHTFVRQETSKQEGSFSPHMLWDKTCSIFLPDSHTPLVDSPTHLPLRANTFSLLFANKGPILNKILSLMFCLVFYTILTRLSPNCCPKESKHNEMAIL